jgi:hypothetical protein
LLRRKTEGQRENGGGANVRKDKEEGGGNQPFTDIVDSFANGITAPTPRIYHQNAEKPQPRYSDDWAQDAFNVKVELAGTFKRGRA